jgi:polyribonucleotide nucleotidyltransferase
VHGSALFQRGETQILGVSTLNMLGMEQRLDTLAPETTKRYMHNYNFPPYSTGETVASDPPKRREIGHGALAERALVPCYPPARNSRTRSARSPEALGSNGSTSMGSDCASTMALLNGRVPLRAPVAVIAMGLVSDTVDGQVRYTALTDILGAEDAYGRYGLQVAAPAIHHRPAAGHQARRHSRLGAGRSAEPGQGRPQHAARRDGEAIDGPTR